MALKVKCLRRSKLWVIVGIPGNDVRWAGPYKSRAEASEDKAGLERFYEENPDMKKLTRETSKKLEYIEASSRLKDLASETRRALNHLTPDTVVWFKEWMNHVLTEAEAGRGIPGESGS